MVLDDVSGLTFALSTQSFDGESKYLEVVLNTEPAEDVYIFFASSENTRLEPQALAFSAYDWDSPKSVRILEHERCKAARLSFEDAGHTTAAGNLDISVRVVSEDPVYFNSNDSLSPSAVEVPGFGNVGMEFTGIFTTEYCTYFVMENEGAIAIPVFRSAGQRGIATVSYQVFGGSAGDGVDFEPTVGVISFADGQSEAYVMVNIVDDLEVEDPNESFFVLFS